KLIQISDDGCGMVHDDALLAFERHATSKIKDADDLLNIATLGFRGEALPSIAAVSRMVLETAQPGAAVPHEQIGTRIELARGRWPRMPSASSRFLARRRWTSCCQWRRTRNWSTLDCRSLRRGSGVKITSRRSRANCGCTDLCRSQRSRS